MNTRRNIGRDIARGVVALLLLGGGFAGGWFFGDRAHRQDAPIREQRLGGYRYINPLLECDSARDAVETEILQPFQALVLAKINEWERRSSVEHVSVYFRELNGGQSFDISANEKFAPASLIKIPLMLAYFKAAAKDPLLLSRRLTYIGAQDDTVNQFFKPAVRLEPGRSYTVEELIHSMIVYSDNNAYYLLFANLSPKIQRQVFLDLGLEVPKVRTLEDYVTVNEYASFFRILFNASYLPDTLSEKALGYLIEAEFAGGLKAGVPQGVAVADKFGEWAPGGDSDIKQLHDCGIIYYPEQPYLLCVMSRGLSYDDLSGVIGDISRVVFSEVNRRYRAF